MNDVKCTAGPAREMPMRSSIRALKEQQDEQERLIAELRERLSDVLNTFPRKAEDNACAESRLPASPLRSVVDCITDRLRESNAALAELIASLEI
jgi:hypothetical protein